MISTKKIISIITLVMSFFMFASCTLTDKKDGKDTSGTTDPLTPEAQIISVAQTNLIDQFRDASKRNEAFLRDFSLDKATADTISDTSLWSSYSVNVKFYNRKDTDITVIGFTSTKNGENGIHICAYGNVSNMGIPKDYKDPCEIAAAVIVRDKSVNADDIAKAVYDMGLAIKYVESSDYVEDKELPASVIKSIPVEAAAAELSADTKTEDILKISSKELAESSFIEDFAANGTGGLVFSPELSQNDLNGIKNDEWTAFNLVLEVQNVSGKDVTIRGAAIDKADNLRIGTDGMELTIPGDSQDAELYAVTLLVKNQLLFENMLSDEDIIALVESSGLRLLYMEGISE